MNKLHNYFYFDGNKICWKPNVRNSVVDEMIEFHTKFGLSRPPSPSEKVVAAMNYNRWLNLHRYEDPFEYMFDDESYSDSSEDESEPEAPKVSNESALEHSSKWTYDPDKDPGLFPVSRVIIRALDWARKQFPRMSADYDYLYSDAVMGVFNKLSDNSQKFVPDALKGEEQNAGFERKLDLLLPILCAYEEHLVSLQDNDPDNALDLCNERMGIIDAMRPGAMLRVDASKAMDGIKVTTPRVKILEQLKSGAKPGVVYNDTIKLIDMLTDKTLEGAYICWSEDGITLQWPHKAIYCEIFAPLPEENNGCSKRFYVNVYNPLTEKKSKIIATLFSNSVEKVSEFLNAQVCSRN
jgi:hypothetical protein